MGASPGRPCNPRAALVVGPRARAAWAGRRCAAPPGPACRGRMRVAVGATWRAVLVVRRARSSAASISRQAVQQAFRVKQCSKHFASVQFSSGLSSLTSQCSVSGWQHRSPRTRWPGSRQRSRRAPRCRRPHRRGPQLARAAKRADECPRPEPSRRLGPRGPRR